MQGLADKFVVITGAGSGIGLATARRFYAEGSRLLLIDISQTEGLKKAFPERTHVMQADVSDPKQWIEIEAMFRQQSIDVLINNAGITRDAKLEKMTEDQWQAVINVNLTAVFKLSQMAAIVMREKGAGVILNAASVVAHYGNYGQANYAASKAGVIALTKTLAKELGPYGIRVNAIAPGFIETPMVAQVPEKVLEKVRQKLPLGRMGQPEEVASVYAFLASDNARYITATVINVDGGLILG